MSKKIEVRRKPEGTGKVGRGGESQHEEMQFDKTMKAGFRKSDNTYSFARRVENISDSDSSRGITGREIDSR